MSGRQCPCPGTDEFCDPPSNECKPCNQICQYNYGAVNGYESRMNSCARHCPKYTKHLPTTKQEKAATQTTSTLPTRSPLPQIQQFQVVGSNHGNGGNVLGAGAIAGCIGGVIILAVIAFVAAMFLLHKKKKKEKTKRKASAKEEEIPLQAIQAPPANINPREEETPLQGAEMEYTTLNEQQIVSEDQNATSQRWHRDRSKSLPRPVSHESQQSQIRNSQQTTSVTPSGSRSSVIAQIHDNSQTGSPAAVHASRRNSANSLCMDASPVTDSLHASEVHIQQPECDDSFPEPRSSASEPPLSRPRKSSLKKSNSAGRVAETYTHPIQEGYMGQSAVLPNGRNPLCCAPESSVQFIDDTDTTEVKSRHQADSVV